MPDGSSSAAPVMSPGPSAERKRTSNGRRRGSTEDTACSGAASTATRTLLLSISSRSCATLPTRSFFLKTEPAVAGYIPIED